MNNSTFSHNTHIERSGTGIERSGTGIERSGTGIERTGTGIERSGTGIERNGTGVRRFGSTLAVAMVAAASALTVGGTDHAYADSYATERLEPSVPAAVIVKGERVSLVVGGSECSLSGTGYQVEGYARFPLTFAVGAVGESILVHGSGTGDKVHGSGTGDKVHGSGTGGKVHGSGTGDKVHGSGTGAPDPDQGTDSMGRVCSSMFQRFTISGVEHGSAGVAPAQLWGEAEISLDGLNGAAVIVYPLDAEGARKAGDLMEVPVLIQ